jgi:2-polyprenyl-3-methyl-5-hydroxy-6-metoxy-1,4-benzoquinol methylase
MKDYNTTQLNPASIFERHVYHRDQFAHYLRWSFLLKQCDRYMNILDFGCGSGELLETVYRNRYKPLFYLGVDIREKTINNNVDKFIKLPFPHAFIVNDLTVPFKYPTKSNTPWDIISCFEVTEHIPREKQHLLFENIALNAGEDTLILISTPNYDPKKGAAENHKIDGVECERTYKEMLQLLQDAGLKVLQSYGTFADMSAIEDNLPSSEKITFMKLKEYHDVNVLSVMFAPLIPQFSRNVLYFCKKFKPIAGENKNGTKNSLDKSRISGEEVSTDVQDTDSGQLGDDSDIHSLDGEDTMEDYKETEFNAVERDEEDI